MELRDFFTDDEIRTMKERIIKEATLANYLVDTTHTYPDGTIDKQKKLTYEISEVIREETVKQVREYVREVVNTVAKERVAAAVDKFSDGLCKQLEKITEKTNWYWSIK